MNVPELVVPAGNPVKLEVALKYGADAVYLSGKQFGLRHYAGNFDLEELRAAVQLVHDKSKKIYLAVNMLCRDKHIEALKDYLKSVGNFGLDALIISDPGVMSLAKSVCPHIPVHLSTQANTLNSEAVRFWAKQGVKRVVLARELSQDEVSSIACNAACEVEVFVHGALCIAYAGRCYLSAYLENRESNEGTCAQPCRNDYYVVQKKGRHAAEMLEFDFDEDNSYVFNSRDLCLIEYLPQLVQAGVSALKIEGRMKTEYYVAVVTRVYRKALDMIRDEIHISDKQLSEWIDELQRVSHRHYTAGFFGNAPESERVSRDGKYSHPYQYVAYIDKPNGEQCFLDPKSKIVVGEQLEIISPDCSNDRTVRVTQIIRDDEAVTAIHPNQFAKLFFDGAVFQGEMLRKPLIHKEGN
ncbi:MAG: U32 family peptidase C-terminal domain-containing protein [Candidatus Auribacterota bacterium]|jgi:putative protease|nr:U32 family peptidase C-terminal domain-containing protein [Candidatus Auribacterota bacterium]